jgi:hypothetical protein
MNWRVLHIRVLTGWGAVMWNQELLDIIWCSVLQVPLFSVRIYSLKYVRSQWRGLLRWPMSCRKHKLTNHARLGWGMLKWNFRMKSSSCRASGCKYRIHAPNSEFVWAWRCSYPILGEFGVSPAFARNPSDSPVIFVWVWNLVFRSMKIVWVEGV